MAICVAYIRTAHRDGGNGRTEVMGGEVPQPTGENRDLLSQQLLRRVSDIWCDNNTTRDGQAHMWVNCWEMTE